MVLFRKTCGMYCFPFYLSPYYMLIFTRLGLNFSEEHDNPNESRWGPISKRAFLAVLTAVLLPCLLSASVTTDDIMKATGARAVGMGGAFSAVSDDYSAFYWNPAGLVLSNKGGANVFYDSIFSGNERNFGLNYTYPAFSDMTVAATYLKTLYMSSKFTDDLFYLTYATYLHEERSVSFGINLKFINISAPDYGLNGFTPGFDAGFMIYPAVPGWKDAVCSRRAGPGLRHQLEQ